MEKRFICSRKHQAKHSVKRFCCYLVIQEQLSNKMILEAITNAEFCGLLFCFVLLFLFGCVSFCCCWFGFFGWFVCGGVFLSFLITAGIIPLPWDSCQPATSEGEKKSQRQVSYCRNLWLSVSSYTADFMGHIQAIPVVPTKHLLKGGRTETSPEEPCGAGSSVQDSSYLTPT